MFMQQKLSKWIMLFLVIPLVLGIILFRPILTPMKIPLPKYNQELEIMPVDITRTPLDDFSKVFFGTPLKLAWYQACLINNNEVFINDVKIQTPYERDPEAGAMELVINLKNSPIQIYSSVGGQNCRYFRMENTPAELKITYRRPSLSSFPSTLDIQKDNEKEVAVVIKKSSEIENNNSVISLKNLWSELLYKLFLFSFFWMVGIVTLKDSWQFVKSVRKNVVDEA